MNTLDEMLLFCYNAIGFRMFCQKEKNFVLTKCKQKICNTKEEKKKNENNFCFVKKKRIVLKA